MEEHFCNQHWRSRKKMSVGVEWSCRLCKNGGRRLVDWTSALARAELHHAGLIISDRLEEEVEYESESSSGGFSSSYDCISSEEAETDLSSVSERETDVEDSEVNDEEKRVNREDIE